MTEQSSAIARRAEKAVLERVALALENEMPALNVELIMTEEGGRMYRLSHPTYLNDDVFLHVQASAFGKVVAAKVLEGKGVQVAGNSANGGPDLAVKALKPGTRYRVRHRSERQKNERESVMVYLGQEGGFLVWDARPEAGTQNMPPDWFLSAESVPSDTTPYVGKMVR